MSESEEPRATGSLTESFAADPEDSFETSGGLQCDYRDVNTAIEERDERWEARRKFNNLRRRERAKETHRARVAAARAKVEALLASMTEEQVAEWQASQEAEKESRKLAAAQQAERVAAALLAGADCSGLTLAESRGDADGSAAAIPPPVRIVIDCSFSPAAPPKEMRSLCKQIENSSSINKRYPQPACLTLTSWGEPLASVAKPCGAAGWRVVKTSAAAVDAFGADRVVVLSPDSTEPLLQVDCQHAYIIGGIVDRTHRKGLTLRFAESQGAVCRRLPIAEHAEQLGLVKGTRKCPVLNIDDVVKALLIAYHTGDWVQALDAAIPVRKRRPQTQGFTVPATSVGSGTAETLETSAADQEPRLRDRDGLPQSSCSKELELASTAFGLSPTADVSAIKVDTARLREYLAKAPSPSLACCGAAASFNNAYCSCSPAVLELVKSFTNNNSDQYREVSKYLGARCKEVGKPFTIYLDATCPPGKRGL